MLQAPDMSIDTSVSAGSRGVAAFRPPRGRVRGEQVLVPHPLGHRSLGRARPDRPLDLGLQIGRHLEDQGPLEVVDEAAETVGVQQRPGRPQPGGRQRAGGSHGPTLRAAASVGASSSASSSSPATHLAILGETRP